MNRLTQLIADGHRRYGDKFSAASLKACDPTILDAFERGRNWRVKVTNPDGYVRTGTVGVTTGRVPTFLLMHRSSDIGSSDVLRADDYVCEFWNGRRYVPAENLPVRRRA